MSEQYTIERAVDLLNSIDPMTEARSWVIDETRTLVVLSDGTYVLLFDTAVQTYQVFDTAGQAFAAVDEPTLIQWVEGYE
tara:strand:- start:1495 stop:1734 length:240 start_codon:yes stop_codon:yes gene_type:complete